MKNQSVPSEKLHFGVVIALKKPVLKCCCYVRLLALISVFEQVFKHPGYRKNIMVLRSCHFFGSLPFSFYDKFFN